MLLLIVPIILYSLTPSFPVFGTYLTRLVTCAVIVIVCLIANATLRALHEIYQTHEISKSRPIKGYLQIVQVTGLILAAIVMLGTLAGKNPWLLLSGIGAFSAIAMLAFRDPLQGLAAGIQLSANDMIRIGDWIELPKSGIAGWVVDISLITVKVRYYDKTVASIPAYTLVSDTFRNWRGIVEPGNRHILQVLLIDSGSVSGVNGTRVNAGTVYAGDSDSGTNLARFRDYAVQYLRGHESINTALRCTARILRNEGRGIPLELYCFTPKEEFHEFEQLQFELVDHLMKAMPDYGLRLFQQTTSAIQIGSTKEE
jgi:miniconductance mechanosensitive channel